MQDNKPWIAIDFDNTLCHSSFPDCGPAIPGGREALELFKSLGYNIIIFSCRACHWSVDVFGGEGIPVLERPAVILMRDWLIEHKIPFDLIDDGSKGKPLAQFYCDDRAVPVNNNWAQVAAYIASHTPRCG